MEEVAFLHIHEGIFRGGGLGASGGPPQEGDHMGPETFAGGTKGGGRGAGGDVVFQGPEDALLVERIQRNIPEGIGGVIGNPGHQAAEFSPVLLGPGLVVSRIVDIGSDAGVIG